MADASQDPRPGSRGCTHQEFIRLFLGAERDLLRYVMVLIPNVADARDVVQETAVALWDKLDQYDPARPFAPWACRFALNEARMFMRKQARRSRLADDVVDMLEAQRVEDADRFDARRVYLKECLRKLPKHQAEIVRAHYFDELRCSKLSERFGQSLEAIYKTIQRTRLALQQCIEGKLSREAE